MRSKTFPVRSRPHRASRNPLDPYPSPASVPGEANERFASGVITPHCDDNGDVPNVETVPETFDEIDAPPSKKRHCLGTSEATRVGRLNVEACIICDILDEGVTRCSGTGCLLWFHGECLNQELGSISSSEDLAKTYCPYCWFKVVMMRHKSVKEKAVEAEKEVSKYLSNEKGVCSSEKEQFQVEKDSDGSRGEGMPLTEERDYKPEDDTEKFEDAEEDKDDEEAAKDQTEGNTDARGNGDVSRSLSMQESSSGKEEDQIQQDEGPSRRRRQLRLNYSDSDISSDESTNERNGKHVSDQTAQVVTTPSGTMKNQQRKHSATTEVAKSNTVRDTSSLKTDQRKRLFWTPEEEEMLRVGVEKFTAEARKNMPWRKILEMGEEVFHETRTPADLKDKWRNRMGARGKKTN
ncbi:unnamed protein product [Eruca vesicaria subsp. sativa]|uniref:Myb-like domain-containing protein n=1 Tax=Eruca vesicaria subsp. sativa TaxID=29727 RepID=A0ABC8L068_ERUVS|nr:unnamed protein product [Eruca vesicaria subsp. sativa]